MSVLAPHNAMGGCPFFWRGGDNMDPRGRVILSLIGIMAVSLAPLSEVRVMGGIWLYILKVNGLE